MKAHDLARQLLAGPDVEVAVHHPKVPDWATPVILEPQPQTYYRYPEEGEDRPQPTQLRTLILDEGDFAKEPQYWPEFE